MSISKRCLADIAEIQKDIYTSQGIYYYIDEKDANKGYACIFGPEGTPYEDCPMIYSIVIPASYPFDPPTIRFQTCDGITRFHPNMYIDGKVCLSILHTWEGPKWTSTMRLSTVFITIQSLMDTQPLRHEPGYAEEVGQKGIDYATLVESRCILYILNCVEKKSNMVALEPFQDIFFKKLPKILERLKVRLEKLLEGGEKVFPFLPYKMSGTSEYANLLLRVKQNIQKI